MGDQRPKRELGLRHCLACPNWGFGGGLETAEEERERQREIHKAGLSNWEYLCKRGDGISIQRATLGSI